MNDHNQSELKPFRLDPFGGDYYSIYFFRREIESKIQICGPDGRSLSDMLFDKTDDPYEEYEIIKVYLDGKASYLNSEGKLLFPLIYDDVEYWPHKSEVAVIELSGKKGLIKQNGEKLFEIEWDIIEPYIFSPKFVLYKNDEVLLYDERRYFIKKLDVDYIWPYWGYDQFALFHKDGKRGTIDYNGNIILQACFDTIWGGYRVNVFKRYTCVIINDDRYGLLDEDGTLLLPCIYDRIAFYKEGIARVYLNDKVGYVEADGTINFINRRDDHYNLYSH